MIIPAEVDLFLRRNDNPFYLRVNVSSVGAPLNMTGFGLRMQMRAFKGQTGGAYLSITSQSQSGSRLVAANGYWEMFLTKSDIDALPLATRNGASRVLYYDILVTDGSGRENTWYEGKVFVDPGVTV